MTELAPAAMAFTMSPENLIPPSAMTGTSALAQARAASAMAVIWGMPAPETTRVVQMEPGPHAHLHRAHPGGHQVGGALVGAHVAGHDLEARGSSFLQGLHGVA